MIFKKKIPPRPPLPPQKKPPKPSFPWVLFAVVLFCVWFVWESLAPNLPRPFEPARLYSNQCQQDIRSTLLSAIRQASSSIHLVMFGLSDRAILSALSKKIHENVDTKIFYDTGGSAKIFKFLNGSDIHPIKNAGLMHQKILILDKEMVFIGSANMTSASLRMHDNLVIGFMSRNIAKFLEEHEPYTPGYLHTLVGGQGIELWLLPDPRGHALTELRKKIRNANRSIKIALFTFTHPNLLEEVIAAHKRGVHVSIVIDMHSGLGASSAAVEALKKAGVPLGLSQGTQLLHHKFIYIDDQTLVTGSANWTKAAFYKNSDVVIALHNLNSEQRRFMNRLWRQVETSTKR
ncbi:MAG TPA: phospholipase D-like domain-containing protein [Chlamydiales bacterium]|nr:phospholipase D-like domain-containing protein [Chlamydiales bacterium]